MKSVRKGVANATGVHGFFSGKKEDQTPQEAEESASGRQTASGEPPSPRPISEPTTDEEGGGAAGIANPIASDPQRESDASAVQSESFAEFDRGGSSIMGGLPSTDDDSRAPSAHVEMREMRETMGASSMGRTSAAAEAASDNPLRSSAAPPPTDSGAAEMAQPSTDAPSDGALWKAKAAQLRADAGERFAPLSEGHVEAGRSELGGGLLQAAARARSAPEADARLDGALHFLRSLAADRHPGRGQLGRRRRRRVRPARVASHYGGLVRRARGRGA